ncbi:BlaI/MecI/CopY family transcriptional regulator [Facklamia languida]
MKHQANFPEITEAEWELMRILWAHPNSTSREVIEIAQSFLEWKEGTIKSLLNRLTHKGLVIQETQQTPYRYYPGPSQIQANQQFFLKYLDRLCTRKRHLILETLVQETELSKSACQTLIDLLERKKRVAPQEVACQCQPGQCDCQIQEDGLCHDDPPISARRMKD